MHLGDNVVGCFILAQIKLVERKINFTEEQMEVVIACIDIAEEYKVYGEKNREILRELKKLFNLGAE